MLRFVLCFFPTLKICFYEDMNVNLLCGIKTKLHACRKWPVTHHGVIRRCQTPKPTVPGSSHGGGDAVNGRPQSLDSPRSGTLCPTRESGGNLWNF